MNTEMLRGRWTELRGKVKQKWGKLTDDDLKQIDGRADELAGRIERRYGKTKEQAEKEIEEFCSSC